GARGAAAGTAATTAAGRQGAESEQCGAQGDGAPGLPVPASVWSWCSLDGQDDRPLCDESLCQSAAAQGVRVDTLGYRPRGEETGRHRQPERSPDSATTPLRMVPMP